MTYVYYRQNTIEAVAGRLYRSAVLSPNQRVHRRLSSGETAHLRYEPAGNTIDIALSHPGRWPDDDTWERLLNALPVNQGAIERQRMQSRNGTCFLYARNVGLR